jgi:hypothetical protein
LPFFKEPCKPTMDKNTTINLHNNQGGLACAFDVLMALQKAAMKSHLQHCCGVQFK